MTYIRKHNPESFYNTQQPIISDKMMGDTKNQIILEANKLSTSLIMERKHLGEVGRLALSAYVFQKYNNNATKIKKNERKAFRYSIFKMFLEKATKKVLNLQIKINQLLEPFKRTKSELISIVRYVCDPSHHLSERNGQLTDHEMLRYLEIIKF